MTFLRTLLVLAILAVGGGVASAQAPGQTGQGAGGNPQVAQKIEKIKQQILAMRAAQLTTALNLDEKTAAKLFPVLSKYDDIFGKLLRENVELRKRAQEAAARNDDRALDDLIDKLVDNQRQRWDTQEARFKDVRKVISPQQAARLLVVLPQIDRKIQQQLRKALNRPGAARPRRAGGRGAQQPADEDVDDDDGEDVPIQ